MVGPMKDTFDFSGKVVLVTGSSRGIGAGMITAFGQAGARCVVNYVNDLEGRKKADAERVAATLADARAIEWSVANTDKVSAMMKRIPAVLGGLAVLGNNSGIM